jgi:hypothetical protein
MNALRRSGLVFADAGLGILAALFVCTLYGIEPSFGYILLGIIFAYAPDVDWVLDTHFWKTGTVAAYAGNPYDHREGLHKPILWALVLSGWGLFVSDPAPLIALIAVMSHFLHDSFGTGWGIPWLWPLTKRRFKLFATKQNEVSFTSPLMTWSHEELGQYITNYGRANWKEYYYGSWNAVSLSECVVACAGALALVLALVY